MTNLLLTPTALIHLALLIQSLVVSTVLMATGRRDNVKHRRVVLLFFVLLVPTALALGIEAGSLYLLRMIALALQVPLIAAVLTVLLLFSAAYPRPLAARRIEMRFMLIPATVYTGYEWFYAFVRLARLTDSVVLFRPVFADYLLLALVLAFPISLFRQARLLRTSTEYPKGSAATAREVLDLTRLTVLSVVVIAAAVVNLLRPAELFSTVITDAVIAQLLLFSVFVFVMLYINAQAEMTSFLVKVVGLILTMVLGLFTGLAWFSGVSLPDRPSVAVSSGTALLWRPNGAGGYDVAPAPYRSAPPQGTRLAIVGRDGAHCSEPIDFSFPLYGRTYPSLFVCNSGLITFDRPLTVMDLQLGNAAGRAAIIAQLADFTGAAENGGVYVAQDPGTAALTVRWYLLRPNFSTAVTDVEVVLMPDGSFTMQFHRIADELRYRPQQTPSVGRWAIGALPPESTAPQLVHLTDGPMSGGPAGLLQDLRREDRQALHRQLLPYAVAMLALSIILVLYAPFMFQRALLAPLNNLISGVERMERGDYSTRIPPGTADEIGFLIAAFNRLSARLQTRVTTLEAEVEHRTGALSAVHRDLRNAMEQRLAAQAATVQQQRDRAALDERLRLSRDLHDSLGQSFASLALLTSVITELLQRGEVKRATATLATLAETAQQGHHEVRRVIGDSIEIPGLRFGLRRICRQSAVTAPNCVIMLDDDGIWDEAAIPRAWLPGLLQIVQEALNNALRHAAARRITVRAVWSAPQLRFEVIDDGCGFEVTAPVRDGHYGLLTMRERADEIGAEFSIDTAVGNGCCIRLCLTLP